MNEEFLPTSFDEYIGQEELKRRLKVYVDEAVAKQQPLPHVLLTAAPGQGKTALAHVLSEEVRDPMSILDLAQMKPQQFASAMRRFAPGILFIDEVHRATKQQQTMLLTIMDEGYLATPTGGRIELDWITVIAATTEPEKLDQAFVDRFTIRPDMDPYTDEEAAAIVSQMARKAGLRMPAHMAAGLGRAAAGTPRMARHLVVAYRALSLNGEPTVEEVLDLQGLDEDGLSKLHLDYLHTLDRLEGMAGEKPLASVLRVSPLILKDVERVLFRRGLIIYTPRGRALTEEGDARIHGRRPGHRRKAA